MAIKHLVTRGFVFVQPPGPATRGYSQAAVHVYRVAVVRQRPNREIVESRPSTAVVKRIR